MSSISDPIRNYFQSRRLVRRRLVFPVNLRHRRILIFPTRQGFVFFALLLAIFFGLVSHNNNLGFLLIFMLGGITLVSGLHTYRNLSRLALLSAKAMPVFAEQTAKFEITVQAQGHDLQNISFRFSHGIKTTVDLSANRKTRISVLHPGVKRGVLEPDQLCVSTTYPLGLVRGWSAFFITASCLVYPKPVAGPMIIAQTRQGNEIQGETGGEGIDDFAGLSVYNPGDPMQHISWKSYSRGQGLYVKKFEGLIGKAVYFDPDAIGGRFLEFKLSRVCYMILKAEAMYMSYGLKVGNRMIEPDQGGSHKRLCLKTLALVNR